MADTILETLEELDTSLVTVNSSVAGVNTSLTTVDTDVRTVKSSVDAVKSSVDTVKTSVDTVNSTVGTVNGSVQAVNTSVGTVQAAVGQVGTAVGAVQGSVDKVNGSVEMVRHSVDAVKVSVESVHSGVGKVEGRLGDIHKGTEALVISAARLEELGKMTHHKLERMSEMISEASGRLQAGTDQIDYKLNTIATILEKGLDRWLVAAEQSLVHGEEIRELLRSIHEEIRNRKPPHEESKGPRPHPKS